MGESRCPSVATHPGPDQQHDVVKMWQEVLIKRTSVLRSSWSEKTCAQSRRARDANDENAITLRKWFQTVSPPLSV